MQRRCSFVKTARLWHASELALVGCLALARAARGDDVSLALQTADGAPAPASVLPTSPAESAPTTPDAGAPEPPVDAAVPAAPAPAGPEPAASPAPQSAALTAEESAALAALSSELSPGAETLIFWP